VKKDKQLDERICVLFFVSSQSIFSLTNGYDRNHYFAISRPIVLGLAKGPEELFRIYSRSSAQIAACRAVRSVGWWVNITLGGAVSA
jgi:hypothetical protein